MKTKTYKTISKYLLLLFLISTSSISQVVQLERVVVTGTNIELYESPAVTLIKPADYLVQKIKILNDSRELELRMSELRETVRTILKSANKNKSIEVGVGNEIIYPINLNNMQLEYSKGERPDTSTVFLYVKTPINKSEKVENLITKLASFINKSKIIGRSDIIKDGDIILSIINPGKYRKELLGLIAKDLNETINIFGSNYKAEITGLSQSLQWERASISELRLYLEYDYSLITE